MTHCLHFPSSLFTLLKNVEIKINLDCLFVKSYEVTHTFSIWELSYFYEKLLNSVNIPPQMHDSHAKNEQRFEKDSDIYEHKHKICLAPF